MPPAEYVGADRLDGVHYDALARAVRNVLQTDLALTTYAQILDGLPVSDIAWDQYASKYDPDHPVNDHKELCPGSSEKANEFRDKFTMSDLSFNPRRLDAYQSAPHTSQSFNLRLIELTASALHQIAVFLFQLDKLHDPATTGGFNVDSVTTWERPPDGWARVVPYPTMFIHTQFTNTEQYSDGVADIAGYWAEDRILGGVPLFDHSREWDFDNEPNVYFQCSRYEVTYRVCQLLSEQQGALISFLSKDDQDHASPCPLPILPGSQNRVRIDPDNAVEAHKVYRDPWEREPPPPMLRMQRSRRPCYTSSLDYPEQDADAEIEEAERAWRESR